MGDDLKRVYSSVIEKTKKTLFAQIYGLSDPDLIAMLQKKAKSGIELGLFYDPSGSRSLEKILPSSLPLQGPGLMHKKILIQDGSLILLGTANLTTTSLCMHDNVVIGIYHLGLAHFLEYGITNKYSFQIGSQPAILWQLPDQQNECLSYLLEQIDKAQESIYLSLFTFTHPKIVNKLLEAKKRGVMIHLALDSYAANGSSKKTAKLLQEQGIEVRISQGGGKLLHHKWALIDHSMLLLGSANWTKSAFAKNEDCLLALGGLTRKQDRYFRKIWKKIQWETTLFSTN